MNFFCRGPITGYIIAGIAAVLPTVIVAELIQGPSKGTSHYLASGPTSAPQTLSAAPANAAADDSAGAATRPSQPEQGGTVEGRSQHFADGDGGRGRMGDGHPRNGPFARFGEGAWQEDAQAAIQFFQANSPNRMAYFDKLQEGTPARTRAIQHLVQMYRPIINFKKTQPDLFNLLVEQVVLRDEAFVEARDNKEADLRQTAAKIVPLSLQARKLRLDLLKQELEAQEAKLAKDESDHDAAIENEVAEIRQDEERLVGTAPKFQNRRGQSMLNFDPDGDPLADAAPIKLPAPPEQAAAPHN